MEITVDYTGGAGFRTMMRQHEVVTDLPGKLGGADKAPTPSELFIAALGTCVGVFAVKYLKAAKIDPEGLSVSVNWDYSEDKARIGRIDVRIKAPEADLGGRKKALLAAAHKCVIHNTLREAPSMEITVDER